MRPATKNPPGRQAGVALVTVLLVFAIVTVIAGSMAERAFLDIRRTERQLVYAQAWQYALAGEAFARQALYVDFAGEQAEEDENSWFRRQAPPDGFARKQQDSREDVAEKEAGLLFKMVDKFEQGELEIAIFDQQAKFNVNNSAGRTAEDNARALRQFTRLLDNLSVEPQLIETLLNWIGDEAVVNREDSDGLSGQRAHTWSSANWLITHLSELCALKDMDHETVNKLAPYLTALPASTAVNVNTAPAPVLQTMLGGVGEPDAEQVIDARGSEGFASVDAFIKDASVAGLVIEAADVTVKSDYFTVFVKSTFAGQVVFLVTVLYRHPETGKIELLSRDRSSRFSFHPPADPAQAQARA